MQVIACICQWKVKRNLARTSRTQLVGARTCRIRNSGTSLTCALAGIRTGACRPLLPLACAVESPPVALPSEPLAGFARCCGLRANRSTLRFLDRKRKTGRRGTTSPTPPGRACRWWCPRPGSSSWQPGAPRFPTFPGRRPPAALRRRTLPESLPPER